MSDCNACQHSCCRDKELRWRHELWLRPSRTRSWQRTSSFWGQCSCPSKGSGGPSSSRSDRRCCSDESEEALDHCNSCSTWNAWNSVRSSSQWSLPLDLTLQAMQLWRHFPHHLSIQVWSLSFWWSRSALESPLRSSRQCIRCQSSLDLTRRSANERCVAAKSLYSGLVG